MIRRQPRSTRTDTRCPDTTLCRSPQHGRLPARRVREPCVCLDCLIQRCQIADLAVGDVDVQRGQSQCRSEEHTSELQSLMRISYAVFCLKKKKQYNNENNQLVITINKY